MTLQRLARIREWHQRRTDERQLSGHPIGLAGTHVGELLTYVDHLEGLLADCEQSGEFQAGAAAERKAICGLIDALGHSEYLIGHTTTSSIKTWFAALCGEINKRGPVPQDALPPVKLRERITELENVLHYMIIELSSCSDFGTESFKSPTALAIDAARRALGEVDQTGDRQ